MTLEIRPSTVQSMMLCPGRTMLDTPAVSSEPLAFGTLVHAIIENDLRGLPPWSREVTLNELEEIFNDDTDHNYEFNRVVSHTKAKAIVQEAMLAWVKWQQQVRPFLPASKPMLEERLRMTIGMHPVTNEAVEMFGTPDAVYPVHEIIVDWKTAGKQWDDKKMQGQMQPMAYNALLEATLTMPGYFAFHFYVYDRSKEHWKLFNWGTPTSAQVDAYIEQAFGMALLSEGEPVYTPQGQGWKTRGWHCDPRYCDAWEMCPGKQLINDKQADKRALRMSERGWKS